MIRDEIKRIEHINNFVDRINKNKDAIENIVSIYMFKDENGKDQIDMINTGHPYVNIGLIEKLKNFILEHSIKNESIIVD